MLVRGAAWFQGLAGGGGEKANEAERVPRLRRGRAPLLSFLGDKK